MHKRPRARLVSGLVLGLGLRLGKGRVRVGVRGQGCCELTPHQLYEYVGSSAFIDVCGAQTSATLFHWLGNSFFANSHLLLFYFRKQLRHFDEYVNSIVEEQHAAVKTSTTGVLMSGSYSTYY